MQATQLSVSDPVCACAANNAVTFMGGHWLAGDVPNMLPQLSAALTTDMTHVHAITAHTAADAAATALLNLMYKHVHTNLYEISITYNNLSCCDEHMLKWQYCDDTFGSSTQLPTTKSGAI